MAGTGRPRGGGGGGGVGVGGGIGLACMQLATRLNPSCWSGCGVGARIHLAFAVGAGSVSETRPAGVRGTLFRQPADSEDLDEEEDVEAERLEDDAEDEADDDADDADEESA